MLTRLMTALTLLCAAMLAGCGTPDTTEIPPPLPRTLTPAPTASCDPSRTNCIQTDEDGDEFRTGYPASTKQTAMLVDRKVTREEYETAFADFQACMADKGLELFGVVTSGDRIRYSSPVAGDDGDFCYETHFRDVDQFWQLYEHPSVDLEASLAKILGCLKETGADLPRWTIPPAVRDQAFLYEEVRDVALEALAEGRLSETEVQTCFAA